MAGGTVLPGIDWSSLEGALWDFVMQAEPERRLGDLQWPGGTDLSENVGGQRVGRLGTVGLEIGRNCRGCFDGRLASSPKWSSSEAMMFAQLARAAAWDEKPCGSPAFLLPGGICRHLFHAKPGRALAEIPIGPARTAPAATNSSAERQVVTVGPRGRDEDRLLHARDHGPGEIFLAAHRIKGNARDMRSDQGKHAARPALLWFTGQPARCETEEGLERALLEHAAQHDKAGDADGREGKEEASSPSMRPADCARHRDAPFRRRYPSRGR